MHTNGLEKEFLDEVYRWCGRNGGECALIVHLVTAEGNEYRVRARNVNVASSFDAVKELRAQVGKENVWIGKSTS
jgi:hypothetical protein